MKNILYSMVAVPVLAASMVGTPIPTPSAESVSVSSESSVETESTVSTVSTVSPKTGASGIGHYITEVTGEMAKNPEDRAGAKQVPCPSFILEPSAKCFN